MLTITQTTLNPSLVVATAAEFYGFQTGPVTVIVTDPITAKGPHRLYAVYAYMFTGEGVRSPMAHELELWTIPKA
jgi:hypothetical protein